MKSKFRVVEVARYAVIDENGYRVKRFHGAEVFIKRDDAERLKKDLDDGIGVGGGRCGLETMIRG